MKVRADSLFDRLNPEQRDVLFLEMSQNNCDLVKAVQLCAKWDIRTSRSSVSRCYSQHFFSWKLDRARKAAAATEELGTFDAETSRLAAQKMFEELASEKPDPKFVYLVRALELEERKVKLAEQSAVTRFKLETEKLKLAERRVTVAERKIERAKSALSNEKLSPQEKDARLRQIFGM